MRPGPAALILAGVLFLAACQPTVSVRPSVPPLEEVTVGAAPLVAETSAHPPRPVFPSTEEGRKVFERICAQCHGVQGLGDGPLATFLKAPQKNPFTDTMRLLGIEAKVADLPSRPANFHNLVQMRLNSPFSMYEVVTLGRAHTAMPAFGKKAAYGANKWPTMLSDEARWNLIFYEWTFATSPATLARGRTLYQERVFPLTVGELVQIRTTCAGCHGPAGDGRGGAFSQTMGRTIWGWNLRQGVGIFTDRDFLVKRKPTELYARIADGHGLMPGYKQRLSVDEIWALVDYIWTFAYQYTPPRGQQP